MTPRHLAAPLLALTISACGTAQVAPPSGGHLKAEAAPVKANIPPPVANTVALAKPRPTPRIETYSVVVNNVKVQDLLFALARDAKVNVDIHPGINGTVTLNAIDQTLPQLLTRIAKQVDMRWEMDGPNLAVMPDSPYLRTYKVDYVNLNRDMVGSINVASQVASTTTTTGQATGVGQSGTGTNSGLGILISAKNHFWETIERNLKEILRETDKILPEGSSETVIETASQQSQKVTAASGPANPTGTGNIGAGSIGQNVGGLAGNQQGVQTIKRTTFREAASVIVTPEAGIVTVRATSRQQEKIQEYLGSVMTSARRQVMIEATIAEVSLSDNYKQGIDWSRFRSDAQATGLSLSQTGSTLTGAGLLTLAARHVTSGGVFSASIKLLETYGTVKVLSSPKLSVLNNQSAVLKVVDNLVYFTIKADTTANQTTTTTTYTTNLNSVPVGLVMNVTPQISDNDTVLLNIRPSISRKFGDVIDPNPDLQRLGVENRIPVIRTREMESMLRVENGNVAVMGGLMEDGLENNDTAVPLIGRIPVLGNLFQNRDDTRRKTELVVFLRPIVIKDASVDGDYASFRDRLPGQGFFDSNLGPNNRIGTSGEGR